MDGHTATRVEAPDTSNNNAKTPNAIITRPSEAYTNEENSVENLAPRDEYEMEYNPNYADNSGGGTRSQHNTTTTTAGSLPIDTTTNQAYDYFHNVCDTAPDTSCYASSDILYEELDNYSYVKT